MDPLPQKTRLSLLRSLKCKCRRLKIKAVLNFLYVPLMYNRDELTLSHMLLFHKNIPFYVFIAAYSSTKI